MTDSQPSPYFNPTAGVPRCYSVTPARRLELLETLWREQRERGDKETPVYALIAKDESPIVRKGDIVFWSCSRADARKTANTMLATYLARIEPGSL